MLWKFRERWCDVVPDEEKQADHQVEAVRPRGRQKRQRRKQPETVHAPGQDPAGDDLQVVSGGPELKPDESVVMISAGVVCLVSGVPESLSIVKWSGTAKSRIRASSPWPKSASRCPRSSRGAPGRDPTF